MGADIFLAAWLFSEENSPGTAMAGEGPPLEGASTPGYALAKDNTGKLSVEVPEEWSAIDGTAWDFRGEDRARHHRHERPEQLVPAQLLP